MPKKSDQVKKTMQAITDKEKFMEFYHLIVEEEAEKERIKTEADERRHNLRVLETFIRDPLEIISYFDGNGLEVEDLEKMGFGDGDVEELQKQVDRLSLYVKDISARVLETQLVGLPKDYRKNPRFFGNL